MPRLNSQQRAIIKRCQQSVTWFLKNFGRLKHTSAGVLPFHPFTYQRKSIKAFRKYRLNVFRKCRQCFAGESMVWTPTGPKRIDSIAVNDFVYSFNEDAGRLDIVQVEEVFDNGEMEVCEVVSKTGHRSVATLDHHYFTYSGEVEAQELTCADRLIEVSDWPRVGVVADKSEAILLGYMLADGYYGHSNSNQGHFTNTCWRYLLEYQKHFHKFFGLRRPIKPHNRDDDGKITSYRIYYSQKSFWDWVNLLGISGQIAEKKQIPDVVFSWDNDSIALFLNRLFAADGWYSGGNCNEVGIGQESIRMLHQIKQLLSRFGIDSKVYPATESSMNKLRIFGGKSFQLFVENIGIFNKEPREEITKGFFFNRKKGEVKEVLRTGRIERVYDLKVPPHHNYVVDGAVVHNSGISKISGAFATWFGMFHAHKTILIVSRRNEDAMGFLRDHIVFLYEHLPEWMKAIWKPIKQNEHEIIFPNGSRIQSLTSHPDVLRSNASSLNIIDEAAFIQGMNEMWAAGWPCSRGDTLIQTENGLIKIEQLAGEGDPWKPLNIEVASDDGYVECDKGFVSGLKPTTIINTYLGFEYEGTHHHRLRTIDNDGDYIWSRLDELQPNDLIVSLPGHFVGKRQHLKDGTELGIDFAEILGLYVGDGSLSTTRPKRFRIFFDPQDFETRDSTIIKFNNIFNLSEKAYEESGGTTENLRLNSAQFIKMMIENGLNSKTCPQDVQIPDLVLKSDEAVLCAFIRGLFDSDGWCYQSSTCMKLGFSTTSEKLAEQTQVALHALGILTRRIVVESSCSKNEDRYSEDQYWRVDVWDASSKLIYRDKIGFLTHRKQKCLNQFKGSSEYSDIEHEALVYEFAEEALSHVLDGKSFRQCEDKRKWNLNRIKRLGKIRLSLVKELTTEFNLNSRLAKYVDKGFYFDTVAGIRTGECETFDLSVPSNNTYLANGIISHNTLQHGGNAIVISTCVAPDTIINTADGLCEIQDLAPSIYDGFDDGYYHVNYDGPDIVGINGLESATKFYKRPIEETRIVTTSCGYEFEASLLHKLPIVQSDGSIGNQYIQDLQIGDFLPVKAGQMVFGQNDKISFSKNGLSVDVITEHLAYLIGVIIAEGHVRRIDKYTANVTIACGDSEVLDKCESWNDLAWNRGRPGQDYATTCYTPTFVAFLEELGVECTTAPYKTIPKRLLRCSEPIIRYFLRGLFDGDGSALTRKGQVCYTSTSKKLIKQIRMLLFNYGIHTYLEISPPGSTTFTRENGEITTHDTLESYRLYVSNNFTNLFYDLIGFDLDRKQVLQENKTTIWSELMPPVVKELLKQLKDTTDLSITKMTKLGLAPNVLFGARSRITKNRLMSFMSKISYDGNQAYDSLTKLLEYDWFNEVKELKESESEVYDFTIPDTHTFIGDCTVHTNTNGVGNWYWSAWKDAEAGQNNFNPIMVNWWDMDWVIEYRDPLSRQWRRIAPRDNIRECTTKEEITKFGPYWSPWLQEQYDALQEQGEAWKFDQEILAEFVGSGNTVIGKQVLAHIQTTLRDPMKVRGTQSYVHPVSGDVSELNFDFSDQDEGLWIWEKPIQATPTKKRGEIVLEHGLAAHSYVMGVDIATGKGRDFSVIEIFDVDTMEQVAEFMARCLPRDLVHYIDRLGRWYNCALAIIERNNGGDTLIDSMRYDVMYPRLWRKKDINDKPQPTKARRTQRPMRVQPYGFSTSQASKPTLNKFLIDFIRDMEGDGYSIYSSRLLKQLSTYVRKRDRTGRDTNKTEAEDGPGNFDDLVIATALAFVGVNDAFVADASNLIPVSNNVGFKDQVGPTILSDQQQLQTQKQYVIQGGASLLMPMSMAPDELPEVSAQRQLDAYTIQLGGIPISQGKPLVTPKKYFYERND